jgi:uncharacterized protein
VDTLPIFLFRMAGTSRLSAMKERILLRVTYFLLAASLVFPVLAEEARPASAPLNCLWQVEGKSNVIYLLGSVHVLKSSDHPLAAPIEAAFSNSQIVLFETDVEKMEQPETQLEMMRKSALPEGETLKQQLSPEVYAKFTKHLEAAGLPPIVFEKMKPAIAGIGLFFVKLQELGVEPEYGVDRYFFRKAQKEKKQIIPLETVEFQMSMLANFTKEEGELLVKGMMEEIDNMAKEYTELLAAWKIGDTDTLSKLLDRSMRDVPGVYKRLVVDRTRNWLPKAEELLNGNKKAIFVVGAGHLVGDEGLVELLKKKGFKARQL